ncbi:MAG: helix-turn-helix domain-containing protein [Actinomycetota bacterium]|nr:helix-turn-helix domain-containing protein [Actinomycetota bacterium]
MQKWAKAGLLRADVERRSLERWRTGYPTWLTTTEVAAALGVTRPRVSQLARRGFLPYERTPDGRRVFRPGQIAVVARARRKRFDRPGGAVPP